jgi:YgiT-type zinc finger domain-containing protein
MECLYCKGKMVKAQAPLSLERRQYHIYWKELPAWVCTQCGEAYFETEEVAKVQRILRMLDGELVAIDRHLPAVTSNATEEMAYVPA